MVKGINKQIIEIRCPESENFDKILLFVKSNRTDMPLLPLESEACSIYSRYACAEGENRVEKADFSNGKREKMLKILLPTVFFAAVLTGLLAVSLIL